MIAFPVRRLFLARAITDMRRSFDTLAGMVSHQLGFDPHSGDAFIFIGKDRSRMKVIFWDRDGFWLCSKRLSKGTFALPMPATGKDAPDSLELDAAQWALLLAGITVLEQRRSPRYQHMAPTPAAGGPQPDHEPATLIQAS